MKVKIQLPYLIMVDELNRKSFKGVIEVRQARKILNQKFRVGQENMNKLLIEMKELGLIKYKNFRFLTIKHK